MTDTIILFFANALFIWGVYGLIRTNDWIDAQITQYAEKWDVPEWVLKPLFDCPPCMSSVYGTAFYLAVNDFNFGLPVYLLCLLGLNFLLSQAIFKA